MLCITKGTCCLLHLSDGFKAAASSSCQYVCRGSGYPGAFNNDLLALLGDEVLDVIALYSATHPDSDGSKNNNGTGKAMGKQGET